MLNKIDILIGKYLSGDSTEEESKTVIDWASKSKDNRTELERLRKIWERTTSLKKDPEADLDTAWLDLMNRAKEPVVAKPAKRFLYLKVAAGIALIVCLSVLLKVFISDDPVPTSKIISLQSPVKDRVTPEVTVISTPDTLIAEPAVASDEPVKKIKRQRKAEVKNVIMITVITGDTAKAFELPDHSIVFLNEHSKLVYTENFRKNNRKISLDGEAFFEVSRDTMQFIVACKNTITKGTSGAFNIKGYGNNDEVEVIVVSGTAEFSGVGKKEYKKLVLKEGERGTFNNRDVIAKSKNVRKDYKWWQKKGFRAKFKRFFEKLKSVFK
jgi:ferric-dicitrate binding protein FerR (iron transport regulator)